MENLKIGKDYINIDDLNTIVIDRCGDYSNKGFYGAYYQSSISCLYLPKIWREATKEEVIEAFEKHLNHRFGEDWKTMKIKERHPDSGGDINNGLWVMDISKWPDGWNVWNENGLLYCNGIWAERLEEEPKIHIKDAIKENTVIHCGTEEEAERILGMAHELGYKWVTKDGYKNNTLWRDYKEETCYNIFDGTYGYVKFYVKLYVSKQIIPSTQIADLEEEKKSTIQDAIKERTVIHCETEQEAKRILDMAHELGYKWLYGSSFKDYNNWGGDCTCYNLFKGMYGSLRYHINEGYTIIPSTQIADLELPKLTGLSLSPEDIKEIKAGEKADNRYALKRDVLTILSVESKLNPDKKISEYLEQFKLILEVL